MANTALEMAAAAGADVDQDVLDRSRAYQKSNVDAENGTVRTEAAAGVSLYSITSSQRASAQEAGEARRVVDEAREQGRIDAAAPVSAENLTSLGVEPAKARDLADAYRQNEAAKEMLQSESVMAGFGNNGGEEFLSYMMTGESLVLSGGNDWAAWLAQMQNRLSAVQNPDGSWSGHHCITSPVFCTAAVIMARTADRDRDLLRDEQQSRAPSGD
jgi:hypothetical protein